MGEVRSPRAVRIGTADCERERQTERARARGCRRRYIRTMERKEARSLSVDFSFFAPEPCGWRAGFQTSRFPVGKLPTEPTRRDDEQWKASTFDWSKNRSRELITRLPEWAKRLSQRRGILFPDENLTARACTRETVCEIRSVVGLMNKFN